MLICEDVPEDLAIGPQSTIVVRDIQARLALQNKGLLETGWVEDSSVIRFQDFARQVLFRLNPNVQVFHPEMTEAVASLWAKTHPIEQLQSAGVRQSVAAFTKDLSPLFVQSEGYASLRNWLEQNPKSFLKWGFYAVAGSEFFSWMCQQNFISSDWLTSFLEHTIQQNSATLEKTSIWDRTLQISLGSSLRRTEASLLLEISRHLDVTVFGHRSSAAYEMLWSHSQKRNPKNISMPSKSALLPQKGEVRILRFSSPLAEVKNVVSAVREDLQSGLRTDQIAIFVAGLDEYLPTLKAYFDIEGIPLALDETVVKLSSVDVRVWVASLRSALDTKSSTDLKLALFASVETPVLEHSTFVESLGKLYDRTDLSRQAAVQRRFGQNLGREEDLSVFDFCQWALQYWPMSGDEGSADALLSLLVQDAHPKVLLGRDIWIQLLEKAALRHARAITDRPTPSGLRVIELRHADPTPIEKSYFLGLNQATVDKAGRANLSEFEQESLRRDTGFQVDIETSVITPEDLDFLVAQTQLTATLCFSETDFSGDVQSPSSYWLQRSSLHSLHVPGFTRWDEIQRSLQPVPNQEDVPLPNVKVPSLSAGSIEKYAECPFSFASRNLFGLEVPEPFDLEVDALTKGRLIHQVLESAIAESPFANRTLQEVETLVDQAALKLKTALYEPILWKGQRRRLAISLLGYLEYEKDWRRRFPKTETILAEARFRGFWNIETDQWLPFSSDHVLSEAEIEISGTIDRVDLVGENRVVVLDYKSSGGQLTGASSWLAKGKYQLWIYMQALKHGLVSARSDMSPMDVVGAFYIDVKGRDRKKGLITEAAVGLAAEISSPAAAKKVLTTEARAIFDSEISESIRAKLKRLKAGHMSPMPSDDKICTECDWRTVCRAQHLMI